MVNESKFRYAFPHTECAGYFSRRSFLRRTAVGFGSLALASLFRRPLTP